MHDEHRVSCLKLAQIAGPPSRDLDIGVHRTSVHAKRPGRHIRVGFYLRQDKEQKAARIADQNPLSFNHERASVDTDAVPHSHRADALDGGHLEGLVFARSLGAGQKPLKALRVAGVNHHSRYSRFENSERQIDFLERRHRHKKMSTPSHQIFQRDHLPARVRSLLSACRFRFLRRGRMGCARRWMGITLAPCPLVLRQDNRSLLQASRNSCFVFR